MLLPSALTCDSTVPTTSSTSKTRFQHASALFASPPLSPPPCSTHPAITNLYSTCRALQSMLSPPPAPTQLPSPPTTHALAPSPFKLRLRARGETPTSSNSNLTPRKKITKRAAAPPRGINKRRRAVDDDLSRETVEAEVESEQEEEQEKECLPSTPKRRRFAPEILPLGLERSDFHTLHLQNVTSSQENVLQSVGSSTSNSDAAQAGREGGEWSEEEDRLLVELVLEKLKLTKSDWQDCARSLGKDRGSVGKRWKSLMGNGDVGLKTRSHRRAKIHGTWR